MCVCVGGGGEWIQGGGAWEGNKGGNVSMTFVWAHIQILHHYFWVTYRPSEHSSVRIKAISRSALDLCLRMCVCGVWCVCVWCVMWCVCVCVCV